MKSIGIVLLLSLFPLLCFAQVSNRQAAVEIVAPKAPAPVIANGKRVLVYELHVTNFGKGPLALRRIEIAGVADLSGDTLTKSLSPVGESSDPARPRRRPSRDCASVARASERKAGASGTEASLGVRSSRSKGVPRSRSGLPSIS
ncbi:MAG TPA: hypothetical protein VGJ81_10090 [Thermoanaerobaculia bacterium]|jgi:hypothetical protein